MVLGSKSPRTVLSVVHCIKSNPLELFTKSVLKWWIKQKTQRCSRASKILLFIITIIIIIINGCVTCVHLTRDKNAVIIIVMDSKQSSLRYINQCRIKRLLRNVTRLAVWSKIFLSHTSGHGWWALCSHR